MRTTGKCTAREVVVIATDATFLNRRVDLSLLVDLPAPSSVSEPLLASSRERRPEIAQANGRSARNAYYTLK